MASDALHRGEAPSALPRLLQTYSIELTARDEKGLAAIKGVLPAGCEVFLANLPGEKGDVLVRAARAVREAGFTPVPHVVARNLSGLSALDEMLAGLAKEAGVDRVLVLGGDRDDPAGELSSALQIVTSGLIEKHGIGRILLACYPEGHPRISGAMLEEALRDKLAAAREAGLSATLVSQFLFDPEPIVALAGRLRRDGIDAPLRVSVAGPADRGKLIRYALRCGVGASLRVLRERGDVARNVLSGETPQALLEAVAAEWQAEPEMALEGVHFFTFGDPARSVRWAEEKRAAA